MNTAGRARLVDAEKIVREVLAGLNLDATPCDGCGLVRYANFQDYKDSIILKGIAERLARLGNPRRGVRVPAEIGNER